MSPHDDIGREDLESFRAHCTPPKDAAARNWAALSAAMAAGADPIPLAPRRAARTAWVAGAVLAAALALVWLRLSMTSSTSRQTSDPGAAMRTHDEDATGGAAVERSKEPTRRTAPNPKADSPEPSESSEPSEPSERVESSESVEPARDEAGHRMEPEHPAADTSPVPARKRPPAPAPIEPNPSSVDRLREEARLIASARAALQKGDHAAALKVLREHERQFPSGAMVTDRNAWMAVVLCRSGKREDGVRRGRQFLDKRPRSTHAEEIRQACEIE